jgi:aspartyl-tRNA(Asn)/glutamyl-tRNA(Gln) amidotransferase subunit C
MNISEDKIDQLAHLARLQFEGEQKETIKADLERIIAFCEKLKEVDTDGVAPLIYINEEGNKLRIDEVGEMISQKDALKNAPDADSDYFRVPKVIRK